MPRPHGKPTDGRRYFLRVGAAECPDTPNFIRRNKCGLASIPEGGGSTQAKTEGVRPVRWDTPSVTLCSVTDFSGRGQEMVQTGSPYRPSSVMANAEPLRNGMTATGSHVYFYSLRGAQPPGEGFFSVPGGFCADFYCSIIAVRRAGHAHAPTMPRRGAFRMGRVF